MAHQKPRYPVNIVIDFLKEEDVLLESVKATVTAEQLARGVDLLRTTDNEVTLIGGHTVGHQIWKSVTLYSEDPYVRVALSVNSDVVGVFATNGRRRLDKMRLVPFGSSVHVFASSASPATSLATTRIALSIFGFGFIDDMYSSAEEALRLMESS